jgi:hypothetical protein
LVLLHQTWFQRLSTWSFQVFTFLFLLFFWYALSSHGILIPMCNLWNAYWNLNFTRFSAQMPLESSSFHAWLKSLWGFVHWYSYASIDRYCKWLSFSIIYYLHFFHDCLDCGYIDGYSLMYYLLKQGGREKTCC